MKESNMLIADIGDCVEITEKSMKKGENFTAGSRLVDGLSIDEDGEIVRDRIQLGEDGIIVVLLTISRENGEVLQGPDIIARGTTFTEENVTELKSLVIKNIITNNKRAFRDMAEVRSVIRKTARNYAYKRIKHSPMIIPIITEI